MPLRCNTYQRQSECGILENDDKYWKKHPTVHNNVPSIFNCSVTSLPHLRLRKQGNKFQINDFFLQREVRGKTTEAEIVDVQE